MSALEARLLRLSTIQIHIYFTLLWGVIFDLWNQKHKKYQFPAEANSNTICEPMNQYCKVVEYIEICQ